MVCYTVAYAFAPQIEELLDGIFNKEDGLDWQGSDDNVAMTRVLRFTSQIWRVHPFREGNTRTCATYAVLYLRSLGVPVTNEPFAQDSVFFRDALVLDYAPSRLRDREPLLRFGAALLGESVELGSLRKQGCQG